MYGDTVSEKLPPASHSRTCLALRFTKLQPDQWHLPVRTDYCSRLRPTVLTLTMSYRFLPRNQIGFVPEKTFSSLKNLGEL